MQLWLTPQQLEKENKKKMIEKQQKYAIIVFNNQIYNFLKFGEDLTIKPVIIYIKYDNL